MKTTFGISWCSLSDSRWALNSLTRSLCVFVANLATLSASWKKANVGRWLLTPQAYYGHTLRLLTSSKRFSASVFREALSDAAGELRALPDDALLVSSS